MRAMRDEGGKVKAEGASGRMGFGGRDVIPSYGKAAFVLAALVVAAPARADERLDVSGVEVRPEAVAGMAAGNGAAPALSIGEEDGRPAVVLDIFRAASNERVQEARWWARPLVAPVEVVKEAAHYASEKPVRSFVGAYLLTRLATGRLDDDIGKLTDLFRKDRRPAVRVGEETEVVAKDGSRIEIRDAETVPTRIVAEGGSTIVVDRDTGREWR